MTKDEVKLNESISEEYHIGTILICREIEYLNKIEKLKSIKHNIKYA